MADKTVVVRLALKASGYSSGLHQAQSATRQFGASVTTEAHRAGSSAMALGAAAATAGKLLVLGIGGAMAVSAKAAIEFESSMAGVAKTTDLAGNSFDKANTPLAAFGVALRNLSMRVPVNVNELARIAELGGQLGIQTPKLIEFTEVIAALGVTTNLGTEEGAKNLARFVNIMGTSQDDFDRLGSTIVALGNNFATTEQEILNFGLRIAPVMKTVGATEEEVFGLAAALTSLGIPAERGGTAVQRWMLQVKQAVDGGTDSLQLFARVSGMSADAFSGLFRAAPTQAFAAFVKGLDDVNRSGSSVFGVLKDLNLEEQRSIQVLLAAASGWQTVAGALEEADIAGEENIALFEEAAKRYGTTTSQIQLLGNSFRDLQIEIGNAILSGGGLAGAIDFVREFFAIVKNNLGLLEDFAKIASVAIGMKLAVTFTSSAIAAAQSATAFLRAKNAVDGVTRSMQVMKIAALGVNVVLGIVTLGASLIAGAMATAAINAAELNAAARALDSTIQGGVNPRDALLAQMKEQGIVTDEVTAALLILGETEQSFLDMVMSGQNPFEVLGGGASDLQTRVQNVIETLGKVGQVGIVDEITGAFLSVADAADKALPIVDAFLSIKRNELRNALFESGLAANKTTDDINSLVDSGINLLGLDVTGAEFIAWLQNPTPTDGVEAMMFEINRAAEEEAGKFKSHWIDALNGMAEEGEAPVEDFLKGISAAVETYRETITEKFAEVNEAVRGGFPVWDEYEQEVLGSLQAVLDSQKLFLEDQMAGILLQGELMSSGLSQATQEWFAALPTATQGALARMKEEDAAGWASFIAQVDTNFNALAGQVGVRWNQIFPGLQEQAFGTMIGNLATQTQLLQDEYGLSAELSAQAFLDGFKQLFVLMGEDAGTESINFLLDQLGAFGGEASPFFTNGLGLGNDLIDGLIAALKAMASRVAPIISHQAKRIELGLNSEFEVDSPSKMTFKIGKFLGMGLEKGLISSMGGIRIPAPTMTPLLRNIVQPVMRMSGGSGGSTTNSSTIILNNPRMSNFTTDLQYASLVGSVRSGTGGR